MAQQPRRPDASTSGPIPAMADTATCCGSPVRAARCQGPSVTASSPAGWPAPEMAWNPEPSNPWWMLTPATSSEMATESASLVRTTSSGSPASRLEKNSSKWSCASQGRK
jgi:hypothetical protein